MWWRCWRRSTRCAPGCGPAGADRGQQICADIARGYLADGGPLPQRLPIISLTFPFLLEFAELVQRWSQHAEREVHRWPDRPNPADADLSQFQRAAYRS